MTLDIQKEQKSASGTLVDEVPRVKNTSFLALFLFYPQRFRIFVETHKEMEKPKRAYVHPLLICPYDPEQEYSKCCAPRRVKCTCALRRKGTGNHYE